MQVGGLLPLAIIIIRTMNIIKILHPTTVGTETAYGHAHAQEYMIDDVVRKIVIFI